MPPHHVQHAHRQRRRPEPRPNPEPRRNLDQRRNLRLVGVGLVLLATLTRAAQLSQRSLYWDDFVIPAWVHDHGLLALYDGHFGPLTMAIQQAVATAFPMSWLAPAVILTAATALNATGWWVLCRRTLPPGAAVSLAVLLIFSPFLMVASGWWSAGLPQLAWSLTMVALLLILTRPVAASASTPPRLEHPRRVQIRRSIALTGVLALGLASTERALTIMPIILAAVASLWILVPLAGPELTRRLRARLRSALTILAAPTLLSLLWTAGYRIAATARPREHADSLVGAAPAALREAILPGMVGGPWRWQRWQPSVPIPDASPSLTLLAATLVAAALLTLGWTMSTLRRPRVAWRCAGLVATMSLGYGAGIIGLLLWGRSVAGASELVMLNLHYYTDWWVATLLWAGGAIVIITRSEADHPTGPAAAPASAPASDSASASASSALPYRRRHRLRRPLLLLCTAAWLLSALASTATWSAAWRDDPTPRYLRNLAATLPAAELIHDQPAPWEILNPVVTPYNTTSVIAGRWGEQRLSLGAVERLLTVDGAGRVVPGRIVPAARSVDGPVADCGWRVEPGATQWVPLDAPVEPGRWVWEFNTMVPLDAAAAGAAEPRAGAEVTAAGAASARVELSMPGPWDNAASTGGEPVSAVEIGRDLGQRFVQLRGGGGIIVLRNVSAVPVCVGAGPLGAVAPVAAEPAPNLG